MITGVFQAGWDAKWFQLLKKVLPWVTTFGYLMDATNSGNSIFRKGANYAARTLGINIEIVEVKGQSELADAIDRMRSLVVAGMLIFNDPVLGMELETIVKLALIHKLPCVGTGQDFVDAGACFR